MNKKINIDLLTIKTLFSDYKPFLIPVFTIVSCIILFFILILPQINEFLRSQDNVKTEQEKLNILKNNLSTFENLSDSQLDAQTKTVSSALPPDKNFEAILNALSYSANVSGTILGNFDFTVGSLTEQPSEIQKFPFLEIELNLTGGVSEASSFLNTLQRTLPISRVTRISISPGASSIKLAFYYKPFPPPGFSENAVISPVSKEGLALIKELELFQSPTEEPLPIFSQEVSSESAL